MIWNEAQAAALIAVVVIAAITAIYLMWAARQDRGSHARRPGQLGDADMFLHALHHEPVWTATLTLPMPGMLPMLPPDPPPADTCPQPAVYTAWGGRTVAEMVDEIFAQACAGVTS